MPSPGALAAPCAVVLRGCKPAHGQSRQLSFLLASHVVVGGPAETPTVHHLRLADAVSSVLTCWGPFLLGEECGHASRGQRRGAQPLPALYVQEKGFALLLSLQIPQSLNLRAELGKTCLKCPQTTQTFSPVSWV